uniref:Mitogen activated protein kinase kinase n=1 Tax=Ganoderma boninense TaxID=34458 RepID=A0A5K1JRQ5_9APHY|nr:Mitogen activated protein kinase kinase [Ganoderma boninense]
MTFQGSSYVELDPFRQTRSGSAFSPWHSRVGTPLHIPGFCLATQVEKAFVRYEELFHERPSTASTPLDPDDLPLESPDEDTDKSPERHAPKAAVILTSATTSGSSRGPPQSHLSPIIPISKYHKKQHSKAGRQRKRAAARQVDASKNPKISHGVKKSVQQRILDAFKDASTRLGSALQLGEHIHTDFSLAFEDVSVARTAFIALDQDDEFDPLEHSVETLIAEHGYSEIDWDGKEFIPILSADEHVLSSLVGRPDDENWDKEVNVAISDLFEEFRGVYHLQAKEKVHRRAGAGSSFPAVSVGISYGGGQQRVGNLAHSPHNRAALSALLRSTPLLRIANFADFALRMTAPDLHDFYADTLEEVCKGNPSLSPNFPNNAFAGATLNLGPRTATCIHTDHYNHPGGMCAITALGNYDYKVRGQLVLKKLKLIIRFPPGSTILIPSALVPHGNIPVAQHERRYSFTQYFAGGIFRWVECGHQTQHSFLSSGGQFKRTGKRRWEESVNRLSTWTQLKEHWGLY